ncbi:MAG: M48 family metallopeptidase [Betaproteobacteria bacterium]|nr:M48 family metallopeptidase [Betaproteobacteria bacterium]
MNQLDAEYFDGQQARRHRVTVTVAAGRVQIRGDGASAEYAVAEATVRPRVGRTPQRIELPQDALLLVRDADAVEALFGAPREEALAHRLESNLPFAIAALVGVVLILWAGYRWGVPYAAREAAEHIPIKVEAQIADQVLKSAEGLFLEPTRLDAARRARLQAVFEHLREASGLPQTVRLEYRRAKGWIGANAFAIPGGVVVVTDQLVEGLGKEALISAVLAHELGHIARRHSMRMLLQDSITALVAMAVFGDATSVAGVAVTFPTTLVHSGYSRDFEREADDFAFDLLKNTGGSPSDFADAMQALTGLHLRPPGRADTADASVTPQDAGPEAQSGAPPRDPAGASNERSQESARGAGGDRLSSYLSTHPDTAERIAAARAAAGAR